MRYVAIALVALFAFASVGCKKDPCEQLAKKLCDGGDIAACQKYVDDQLSGPDGKPLEGDMRASACSMLLTNEETFALYKKAYDAKKGGEKKGGDKK